MFVHWRTVGDTRVIATPVDMKVAERLTHDGTDKASTVAKLVFDAVRPLVPEWAGIRQGSGPSLEILEPAELSGTYRISVSSRERAGKLRIGTAAHHVIVPTTAERERSFLLAEGFTDPETVESAYDFLGNIYGHEISGARNDAEDGDIETLRALYDDATLHGLGWPVRSKARDAVGFLAHAVLEEGQAWPNEEAFLEFAEKHGCVAQKATSWAGKDSAMIVCFVPMSRIGETQAIAGDLDDLAAAVPAVAP